MNNDELISQLSDTARKAAQPLRASSYQSRQKALLAIAEELDKSRAEILAANREDVDRERTAGLAESLIDRLLLNDSRIDGIIGGIKKVVALPDPLGRIINSRRLENGLELTQVSVPFGVIGMIYEARPNVTVDAAVILLMSGNASLMRGSSTARKSNEVLINVIKKALAKSEISPDVIQLVPSDDRDTVRALLHARGKVDLVIPRGSASLIRTVVDEALVPTIETGAGVCHVFVDKDADLEKALPIVLNAKTHRPSVCNAAETLLVHESIAERFLPLALKSLDDSKVKLHCDSKAMKVAKELGINAAEALESNWSTEYGVLEMNVGVVSDVDAAMDHINKYGTQHTEAIVTENQATANRFIALSDCAAVMVNASTRFTDGEEMGFGAEIGISNQKLHARGPMGLDQMTTTTWIVRGSGQIRK